MLVIAGERAISLHYYYNRMSTTSFEDIFQYRKKKILCANVRTPIWLRSCWRGKGTGTGDGLRMQVEIVTYRFDQT